jgi:hypothetical protein
MPREILLVLFVLFVIFLSNTQRQQAVTSIASPTTVVGGFGNAFLLEECSVPDTLTNTRIIRQSLFGVGTPIYNTALEQLNELKLVIDNAERDLGILLNLANEGAESGTATVPISTLNNYIALARAVQADNRNLLQSLTQQCFYSQVPSELISEIDASIAIIVFAATRAINMQRGMS